MKFLNVKDIASAQLLINQTFFSINKYEEVDLINALGRVIENDIFAKEPVPPFARSSVDGYAVKAEDVFGAQDSLPALLSCLEEVQMGSMALPIDPGFCRYVPTGGMLPFGADAVVMIEHTERMDDLLSIYRQAAPGENVIQEGEDVALGSVILEKAKLLRPSDLGALAALGIDKVNVFKKPVVAIISTGNELVPHDTQKLDVGKIRDINTITLMAAAKDEGAEVIFGGIIKDTYDALLNKVKELIDMVDMVVISGGSSVGTKDYTAQVLSQISNGQLILEGIAVKPGKPTLLANYNNKPILGLPGHPVAASIVFDVLGSQILRILKGEKIKEFQPTIRAKLTKNIPSHAGRTDYVRVRLISSERETLVEPIFGKSGLIKTLVDSEGMVIVDKDIEGLLAGTEVNVRLFE